METITRWTVPGRASAARWRKLSQLMRAVECGVEAVARLDAYDAAERSMEAKAEAGTMSPQQTRSRAGRARDARLFDQRMTVLDRLIQHELDRLTAEWLVRDLAAKRARWANV